MIINSSAADKWDGKVYLFTGGWDKVVKQWAVGESTLNLENTVNTDIVVNAIAIGEQGSIYAGGSDGHIVRIDY